MFLAPSSSSNFSVVICGFQHRSMRDSVLLQYWESYSAEPPGSRPEDSLEQPGSPMALRHTMPAGPTPDPVDRGAGASRAQPAVSALPVPKSCPSVLHPPPPAAPTRSPPAPLPPPLPGLRIPAPHTPLLPASAALHGPASHSPSAASAPTAHTPPVPCTPATFPLHGRAAAPLLSPILLPLAAPLSPCRRPLTVCLPAHLPAPPPQLPLPLDAPPDSLQFLPIQSGSRAPSPDGHSGPRTLYSHRLATFPNPLSDTSALRLSRQTDQARIALLSAPISASSLALLRRHPHKSLPRLLPAPALDSHPGCTRACWPSADRWAVHSYHLPGIHTSLRTRWLRWDRIH